jgi:Tfp pilus assembly protein PilF
MTSTQTPPGTRYARAHGLFDAREFDAAASILAELSSEVADGTGPDAVAVRLLLARAYYHSAQLRRAEAEVRAVLAADPANAYAHLLLGRTLERLSRHAEARGPLRLAEAMGVSR